jgi:hypothetical protein
MKEEKGRMEEEERRGRKRSQNKNKFLNRAPVSWHRPLSSGGSTGGLYAPPPRTRFRPQRNFRANLAKLKFKAEIMIHDQITKIILNRLQTQLPITELPVGMAKEYHTVEIK